MKLTLATILGAFTLTNAKLRKNNRRLVAENAGAYHTDAFEQLAKKYSNTRPQSKLDLMMDISDIVANYCPSNDSACRSNAYAATLERFHIQESGKKNPKNIVPDEIDDKVKNALRNVYSTLSKLDQNNVDSVIGKLDKIQKKITKMKDVNPAHQMIGVAAVSVAKESSSYWINVYNDKSHPFTPMLNEIHDNVRHLQVSGNLTIQNFLPLNYSGIVTADTKGAVEYSILAVNTTPNLVFNFAELLLKLIAGSIPASAAVAFEIRN